MNTLFKPGVISKGKSAASSREIAGRFRRLPALIENPRFSREMTALISQPSFRTETSSGVAKYGLFSQATPSLPLPPFRGCHTGLSGR